MGGYCLSNFGDKRGKAIPGRKLPPEPLRESEVRRIFQHLDHQANHSRHPHEARRAAAFVVLTLRGLLRSSEALSLYPKDIDLDTGVVRVLCGKGKKSRVVGLDRRSRDYIWEWMEARKLLKIDIEQPLFCVIQGAHRGHRLLKSWPRKLMKRLQQQCGFQRRLHPHGLRHSGAVHLLNRRIPITVISQALGHSNITTTHRYLNHLHPGQVLEAMTSIEW